MKTFGLTLATVLLLGSTPASAYRAVVVTPGERGTVAMTGVDITITALRGDFGNSGVVTVVHEATGETDTLRITAWSAREIVGYVGLASSNRPDAGEVDTYHLEIETVNRARYETGEIQVLGLSSCGYRSVPFCPPMRP